MGRKKLNEKVRRTKSVIVRLNEKEKEALENIAEKSGGTASSILREVINRAGQADIWQSGKEKKD